MAGSRFDVFGRLLLDGGKQFVADAVKVGGQAGDAAGKTMGSRTSTAMRAAMGAGVKVLAGGAAAAFGIAAKGALEMENAMARYRAETGATAEEAERALDAANKVAGSQRMSLDAVTDVAIRVKRDLGAVGDEADQLTEQFARFARVTRQDAAGAVVAFDGILDAWGLGVEHSAGLMDKLLVSTQRFGGSLEERQGALARMAPQMRALNLEVDDGIALLNLFEESGVDASKVPTALNSAIQKLDGKPFMEFVAELAAIPDEGERARRAMEVLGARGGASLATALGKGAEGLDAWAISAEDAAGATQEAADAIDNTVSGRLAKWASEAGAALRGLGADFGPLLTGAAAVASLGGSLGLDKALAKGFGSLASSSLVKGAASRAGLAVGLIFSGAMFVTDKLTSLASAALMKLPVGLAGPAAAAGSAIGGILAAAIPLGIVAAGGAAIALAFKSIFLDPGLQQQTRDIGAGVGQLMVDGTVEQLQTAKAAIEKGIADIKALPLGELLYGDQIRDLQIELDRVNADIEAQGQLLPESYADGIEAGAPAVGAAVNKLGWGLTGKWGGIKQDAREAGEEVPKEIGAGILSRQARVGEAMDVLINLQDNIMSRSEELAYLHGVRTDERLAKGLQSQRPAVRRAAQAVLSDWEQRMTVLASKGGKAGEKADRELAKALKSKIPEVRAAAQRVIDATEAKLDNAKGAAGDAGEDAGEAFAARLRAAARAGVIELNFGGRFSVTARAAGGPLAAGQPAIIGEKGPELWVPDVPGTVVPNSALRSGMAPAQVGGDTININAPITGILRADDPGEVAARLGQMAAGGLIRNPRRERRVEVPSGA
jgi:hypothetical protein